MPLRSSILFITRYRRFLSNTQSNSRYDSLNDSVENNNSRKSQSNQLTGRALERNVYW